MENHKTKKVHYYATPSAAEGYPCEILPGSSVGDAIVPYGIYLENSWGGGSHSWVIGDDRHIAPDTLYIRYYSLVDDKFYGERYPLDQVELYRLLTTTYKDKRGEILSYYTFTVSVGPNGWVGLWLGGSAGDLEICHFRAREKDYNFERELPIWGDRAKFVPTMRKKMFSFVQKELAEKRISSNYWERLSKKYQWKLEVNDPGFEVYDYSVDLINVERREGASNGNWLTELNEKSIPSEFCFFVKHDKDPLRYKVWIEVVMPWDPEDNDDEKQTLQLMQRNRELMELFDHFYAEAGDEEVSLLVELNKAMTSAKLKLKTATKEKEIEGCNLYGIFDSDSYDIDR
ncbi:MAG: DUF2931 family protein [Candidatus Symbiothrix sp.]|nr:DUF2931 family protein [Candidatus Symbiothrix sp.]